MNLYLTARTDQRCLFSLMLLLWSGCLSSASAGVQAQASQATLSEDRKYLESDCPHAGMQELLLYKEGVFKFTSYDLDSRATLLELAGRWQLDANVLKLDYVHDVVQFQVESRVHEFLEKKFLLVVLTPVISDTRYPFTTCTYVDKRLVKEFTGIE